MICVCQKCIIQQKDSWFRAKPSANYSWLIGKSEYITWWLVPHGPKIIQNIQYTAKELTTRKATKLLPLRIHVIVWRRHKFFKSCVVSTCSTLPYHKWFETTVKKDSIYMLKKNWFKYLRKNVGKSKYCVLQWNIIPILTWFATNQKLSNISINCWYSSIIRWMCHKYCCPYYFIMVLAMFQFQKWKVKDWVLKNV